MADGFPVVIGQSIVSSNEEPWFPYFHFVLSNVELF